MFFFFHQYEKDAVDARTTLEELTISIHVNKEYNVDNCFVYCIFLFSDVQVKNSSQEAH